MKMFRVAVMSAALLSTVTPALADDSKIEMSKLSWARYAGYNKDNMSLGSKAITPRKTTTRSSTSARWTET